ncbi:MAG: hypothetical protein Q8O34_01625 [Rhodocyclaceae bacterium]|nr:hypothetical protein [Rhodocyclaceae bacterium]
MNTMIASGERRVAGISLPTALAISLALHAAVLAVGGGSPASRHGRDPDASVVQPAMSGPAPLTVRLFVMKVTPALLDAPPRPSIAAVDPQAPVVGDPASGTGDEKRMGPAPAEPSRDAGAPPAGMPVPVYFDAGELTRRATILEDVTHSDKLQASPGTGKVILVLFISETGRVDRVEVESSRLTDAFQSVISGQFLSARFAPAERDGIPVKSRMRIEVLVRPLMKY